MLMTITYSRSLHSAAFSFIGAMGFLASAVLPADSYLVHTSFAAITDRRCICANQYIPSLDMDV